MTQPPGSEKIEDVEDLEDTVIGVERPAVAPSFPEEDTIVRGSAAAPYPLVEPAAVEPAFVESAGTRPGDQHTPDSQLADSQPADGHAIDPARRYHAIRIGTHELLLDAPTLVGRRPKTPRIVEGQPPRLVRVPSLSREISSTHLEVRQEGQVVVVTDLESSNGTIVTAPGGTPLTLRQGESVVVVAGTVVDIGDGITIDILPIRTPAPRPATPTP